MLNRRDALRRIAGLTGASAATAGAGLWLATRKESPAEPPPARVTATYTVARDPRYPELVVARGADPEPILRRAIDELGGIARFVSRGDTVVLKPNAAWDRAPWQAANTSPEMVAGMARLCAQAGARRVLVADVTINSARDCYERSGIGAAARDAGAEVVLPAARRFRQIDLGGRVLAAWPVFDPFLDTDKVINIAAVKHHSLTGATLGIKNWYGILGGFRQRLHQRIHESLADLASFLRPTLTVLDAWRVLLRNGPNGGRADDVALRRTVIAATDPVAADAWAAKEFWNLAPADLPYLGLCAARGLGKTDLQARELG